MSDREGTVVAVCLSENGGVPKHPQERVRVTSSGVEGDFHSGDFDSKGHPNLRQVTVVGAESIETVGTELGADIPPGGLGENILVRGLGDLGDLKPGQRLRFSTGVELEITEQNEPCRNLMIYGDLAVKLFYGRRGLLTIVAAAGDLAPGDNVSVIDPA